MQVQKQITVSRSRDGKWYIFENVSAWVCPHCGHRYFDTDAVSEMEKRMTDNAIDARPIEGWVISLPAVK